MATRPRSDGSLLEVPRNIPYRMPLHRKRNYRNHAKIIIVPILLLFIFAVLYADNSIPERWHLIKRAKVFENDDLANPFAKKKCENIYSHPDQCAFVLERCEESEVGILHYLTFYFCTLGNVRPIGFILMVLWLGTLFSAIGIAASDFFCPNLATLAQTLRMSESMAGVTFLALGNGSPDLFSTFAAMKVGSGSLAIGELIGAAFFISSVVAGSMAIVNPFKVSRKSFVRDAVFFAGAVAFSVGVLADGKITTWETSCMIAYYVVYVFVVVMATWYWGKRSKRRRTESRARQHYRSVDESVPEVEDDEPNAAQESTALIGDVRDLEEAIDDEEGEDMEQTYAGLQHRMSLVRPSIENLKIPSHNHSNIRPSLFGALEFRSLSSKLASASAVPRQYERRYSAAQSGRGPFNRNFSESQARTAPPDQAPWKASDGRSVSYGEVDYFSRVAPTIQRPISPFSITSIAESSEEEDLESATTEDTNVKSQFLQLPKIQHGKTKPHAPALHLDTSETTLDVATPSHETVVPGSSLGFRDVQEDGSLSSGAPRSRIRWWPYFMLPEPHFLFITLFPTLHGFKSKSWFQRIVAILAVPAVFCLTITLPVIDMETEEADGEIKLPSGPTSPVLVDREANEPSRAVSIQSIEETLVPRSWNRWLTGVQCIFAPLFLTFIFFENDNLLLPILYALVTGLIALALLLAFTTPNRPPNWHKALCAIGFIVSIGWISTIADEVVGILRAFGAILGVSEAILGVTVFAVGNSLSDFVADVTVARMGYPMMALAACFGGPMLNILLGVGVSGLFMNLTTEPVYHIEISPTLLVSTACLFVTLATMLIVVPLNKWRMTRLFGICLVAFFSLSMVVSVIVEILV